MTQYLLSIYQPDGPPPATVDLERIMRDVGALRTRCRRPAPGSSPAACTMPAARTRGAPTHDGSARHRRPVAGGQGTPRRLHRRRRPRSRRRAGGAASSPGATTLPIEVRPFQRRCPSGPGRDAAEVERVFRADYGRAVAVLVRLFGDIDVAEEAVQDAFTVALERWPAHGLPPSPVGWIITTAATGRSTGFRREASRDAATSRRRCCDWRRVEPLEEGRVRDDRLRLIFTCCHPALAAAGAGGAHAAAAGRPDDGRDRPRLPGARGDDGAAPRAGQAQDPRCRHPLPRARPTPTCRTASRAVLAVVYLVFNEGYAAASGDSLVRATSAPRRSAWAACWTQLMPDEPEVLGLLALLLLIDARRAGPHDRRRRPGAAGRPGPRAVGRGAHRRGAGARSAVPAPNQPGPYQIQAAINAVHSDARIAPPNRLAPDPALYDHLVVVHADAGRGAESGGGRGRGGRPGTRSPSSTALPLGGFHVFHAMRADLLRRLGRVDDAALAYDAAIAATANLAEQAFLQRRRNALASASRA